MPWATRARKVGHATCYRKQKKKHKLVYDSAKNPQLRAKALGARSIRKIGANLFDRAAHSWNHSGQALSDGYKFCKSHSLQSEGR